MKAVTDPYEQQYQQWASQLSQVDDDDDGEVKQVIIDSQDEELDDKETFHPNIEQPEQHNNNNGYYYQNQPSSFDIRVNTPRAPEKYYPSYSTPNDVNININFNRYNTNINNNNNNGDAYEMQYQQFYQQQQQQNQNILKTNDNNNDNNYKDEQTDQTTQQAPVLDDNNTQNTPEFNKKEELTQEQLQEIQDQEERFLRMVSNEISYKKMLGQSPYSITDIDFPLIFQRFLDNLEDSSQKSNGKFMGQSKLQGESMPKEERKTVVVLGTGWGAHAFIKLASTYDLRVVVVSPVNHFVFTPMLASAAVGTVEYRSMTEPIRVTNPYIDNFVEGRAIGVNVEEQVVQVQLTSLGTVTGAFKGVASNDRDRLEPEPCETQIIYDEEGNIQRDDTQGAGTVIDLNYDYLICAVGTQSRSSMIPGAKEHSFNLKTSQDSKRLRTAIGEMLEFASRPDVQEYYYSTLNEQMAAQTERQRRVRIAIVGGGPTGVELAGELSDFFAQICRYPDGAFQHLREDIEIMLIHGGQDLLPAMDKPLRDRALVALEEQGVTVRLNTRLKEVGRDYITIYEKSNPQQEETIPVGLSIWAAGNAPVPFVKELLNNLPKEAQGSQGRINVDGWLRCPTFTKESFGSILVIGDIACLENNKGSKYGLQTEPLPQTAQVAGQQGAFAARMLNRGYNMQTTPPKFDDLTTSITTSDGEQVFSLLKTWLLARDLEEAPEFNFLSLGLLAYVGQEEALNQVMLGDVPIFNYSGKVAFALWRSVYLAKQASSRNQALIAFDWLRTETFGRDITRL